MGRGQSPKVLLELVSRTAYSTHGLCRASRDSPRPYLTNDRHRLFLRGIAVGSQSWPVLRLPALVGPFA